MLHKKKVIDYSMSSTQSEILRILRKEAMEDYMQDGSDINLYRVIAIDEVTSRMMELSLEFAREVSEKRSKNDQIN